MSKPTELGPFVEEQLGSADKAGQVFELNAKQLQMPPRLEPGTLVRVPQHTWPAVAAFGAISLLLLVVGMGWIRNGRKPK